MIDKKEPDLLIRNEYDFKKVSLYLSPDEEGRRMKLVRLNTDELGTVFCVYNEEQAKNLLRTILFHVVILPANFSPDIVKHLISENYHAEFDSVEGEWSLYSNLMG